MRRISILTVAIILLAPLAVLASEGAAKSVSGEVLDLACYLGKGKAGMGKGHAACAKACVKGGQPMGLMAEDGTVYLLAADHDSSAAFEEAKKLAGGMATITGPISEASGIKMLTVQKAEKK